MNWWWWWWRCSWAICSCIFHSCIISSFLNWHDLDLTICLDIVSQPVENMEKTLTKRNSIRVNLTRMLLRFVNVFSMLLLTYCSGTTEGLFIYLLKLLQRQGMPSNLLAVFTYSIVISRVLYALPVWGGFLSVELINKINSFFKRLLQCRPIIVYWIY